MSYQRFTLPRRNDPLVASFDPIAKNQCPSAKAVDESKAKLVYIRETYRINKIAGNGTPSFNQSLVALRRWRYAGDRQAPKPKLNYQLLVGIRYLAQKEASAQGRHGPLTDADLEFGEC